MRIALIADSFPPLRSSAAVQLRDLSEEFARQGHAITVMVASPGQAEGWRLETWRGVEILRLKAPRNKDIGYVRRTLAELLMPFSMLRNYRCSTLADEKWDGVVWYSPTIFLGPMVKALKTESRCPAYLIIRDIFPEWAVDMGLMGTGLPYRFFKKIANYQYAVADVIGIQTPGNHVYFEPPNNRTAARIEVLQNWLAPEVDFPCSIALSSTALAGKLVFVYAGNMGVAQGVDTMLDLAARLRDRSDLGFLFVGRGSEAARLRERAHQEKLDNVVFFDEIEPDEIPGLYRQCHVGLVALDPRHKTHNIPGKFLSYMRSGLPVLACVNEGNDLVELINDRGVGKACTVHDGAVLAAVAGDLVEALRNDPQISARCRQLAEERFSASAAVKQIVASLEG
ncbi:MAG: glycosyltransferase family 4 protein [Pseudomonadota bacterium]|nr:glycosyltransferase family 4 protein [Pseudomonadota bacterium]